MEITEITSYKNQSPLHLSLYCVLEITRLVSDYLLTMGDGYLPIVPPFLTPPFMTMRSSFVTRFVATPLTTFFLSVLLADCGLSKAATLAGTIGSYRFMLLLRGLTAFVGSLLLMNLGSYGDLEFEKKLS